MVENPQKLPPSSGNSPETPTWVPPENGGFSKKISDVASTLWNQAVTVTGQAAEKIAGQIGTLWTQVGALWGQAAEKIAGTVNEKISSGIESAKGIISEKMPTPEPGETRFVSIETESDRFKRKNLYYVSAFIGFVWMLFHFTVVYFFGIELGSAALVGIFLGFWNLVSLALDIPVGALQKYFYAKKLYLFAAFSQLAAAAIFLKFIYASSLFSSGSSSLSVADMLTNFMDSGTNILLLVLAAVLYGFTKEVNDLTTLSYILNNSDPSEYSGIISKNNIFYGGGSLFGLVTSGFVLALNPTIAVAILIAFIAILIAFMTAYFDNSERTIDFSAVTKLKVVARMANVEKVKEYAVGYVSKADFATLAKGVKFVFLRPMRERLKFDFRSILGESKKEAISIKRVITEPPLHFWMLWAASVVLAFGFWDTFATSFLIEYLVKLSNKQMAYVMLAIIAIPAFVAQDPFIRLSKRIWNLPVVVFGIVLSGISLLGMTMASSAVAFILLGIVNSIGYAAGMGISQGAFLDAYNAFYAKKFNLSEIDSNASASPMKIIQNLANVIGLFLGGLLLAIFGFAGFFAVFGLMLTAGAVASVFYRKKIAG